MVADGAGHVRQVRLDLTQAYVRWGLRRKNNEDLRNDYIGDTRPLLTALGIVVPADRELVLPVRGRR